MNNRELLAELRQNLLRDDAEIANGQDDKLWSDSTLFRYLNDAQNRFARRTLVIRDNTTPEVVEVVLAAGQEQYVLHPSVVCVVSGRYDDDAMDLGRAGHMLMYTLLRLAPPYFHPEYVNALTPGRPRAFSTDETVDVEARGAVTLTVFPAPTSTEAGKIVHLRVARKPLCKIEASTLDATCEIPDDYQLDMLEWAAFRAFRTSDVDGHSDMAVKCEGRFNDAVSEVLKDMRNKLRVPMRWGFGANAFNAR